MNYESIPSRTEEVSQHVGFNGSSHGLYDALHDLAQPLTALLFVLELGRMQDDPNVWRSTLDEALGECKRAVHSLEIVRDAVDALDRSGGCKQ